MSEDKQVRITRREDALIPGPPFTRDELLCLCALMYNTDRAHPDRFFTSLYAKLVKMLAEVEGEDFADDEFEKQLRREDDLIALAESRPRCARCDMLLGDDVHKGFDGELVHQRCCTMCGDNRIHDGPPPPPPPPPPNEGVTMTEDWGRRSRRDRRNP